MAATLEDMHDARDRDGEPSSSPCFMDEFADELLPGPLDWDTVRAFRKNERSRLIAARVVTIQGAPVEFWQWRPDAPMRVGFWNIPVPADRRLVVPDVSLIPLVGFDAARYRLGYGGGYYDRTRAAAAARPLRVGIGYAAAELATIHPQPHDIPMDLIVTEEWTRRAGGEHP